MLCPQCGASVTYAGLNLIECIGKGCENYRKPEGQPKPEFDFDRMRTALPLSGFPNDPT